MEREKSKREKGIRRFSTYLSSLYLYRSSSKKERKYSKRKSFEETIKPADKKYSSIEEESEEEERKREKDREKQISSPSRRYNRQTI